MDHIKIQFLCLIPVLSVPGYPQLHTLVHVQMLQCEQIQHKRCLKIHTRVFLGGFGKSKKAVSHTQICTDIDLRGSAGVGASCRLRTVHIALESYGLISPSGIVAYALVAGREQQKVPSSIHVM